ncbi:FAD-dependent oxidoreductase, partial [Enterobacter hormaechei]|nr:FAD-dependent oxidoreductase [Enterobacter hormaechei]
VINQQTRMRQGFYERNGCRMFSGEATFIDDHRVSVRYADDNHDILSADKIIIATGSRPYCPPDVDFTHSRIYNSDSILKLDHEPRHVIIYGAGVIGCEYASI